MSFQQQPPSVPSAQPPLVASHRAQVLREASCGGRRSWLRRRVVLCSIAGTHCSSKLLGACLCVDSFRHAFSPSQIPLKPHFFDSAKTWTKRDTHCCHCMACLCAVPYSFLSSRSAGPVRLRFDWRVVRSYGTRSGWARHHHQTGRLPPAASPSGASPPAATPPTASPPPVASTASSATGAPLSASATRKGAARAARAAGLRYRPRHRFPRRRRPCHRRPRRLPTACENRELVAGRSTGCE